MTTTPFESIARLISEIREHERDAHRNRDVPCQSENNWHARDFKRWADALDGDLSHMKALFARHCIQCPQCQALALETATVPSAAQK